MADVTEAMVEAAARAIYDIENRKKFWSEVSEAIRNRYRPEARKILKAAERVRAEAVAQETAERTAICAELGCIDKPGVPLRFVRDLRAQLSKAGQREVDLIRMWNPASPTERQELDHMRRGWGPSSPTERMRRRENIHACFQAISIAMSDVVTPEGEEVEESAQARLDEAYDRLSKAYSAVGDILHEIADDPAEWPDIKAAEERGHAAGRREGWAEAREAAAQTVEGCARNGRSLPSEMAAAIRGLAEPGAAPQAEERG